MSAINAKVGSMNEYQTVSDIARLAEREFGVVVTPRTISDLLYQRKIDLRDCPVVAGRRLVPPSLVPAILRALKERGWARGAVPKKTTDDRSAD